MNPAEFFLLGNLHGQPAGIVKCLSRKDHIRTESPAGCHLHKRRKTRHHHRHWDLQ